MLGPYVHFTATYLDLQPPGVGYRMMEVKEADGNLVITHKGTIEKVVEIDTELAKWTRRGAETIANGRQSVIAVARLFNEHKVGGKQAWTDGRVRQHYGRGRLVGKDVFHKTKQVLDRQTGKQKIVQRPEKGWMVRNVPHLRILTDDLANAVKRTLSLGANLTRFHPAARVTAETSSGGAGGAIAPTGA
jgi:site-specific DNA recombinase